MTRFPRFPLQGGIGAKQNESTALGIGIVGGFSDLSVFFSPIPFLCGPLSTGHGKAFVDRFVSARADGYENHLHTGHLFHSLTYRRVFTGSSSKVLTFPDVLGPAVEDLVNGLTGFKKLRGRGTESVNSPSPDR